MATAWFDGPNLNINIPSGTSSIDVQVDLYSDWKEWVQLADNARFPQAFDTTGGDPLGGGQIISPYFFLRNDLGWRLNADAAGSVVTYEGNLFARDQSIVFEDFTAGGAHSWKYLISPQSITTLTGIDYLTQAVWIDTERLTNGTGTQQSPFNNWSDAIDFAEAEGLKTLKVLADATVDRLIKNFVIEGIGDPTIDFNGQNVDKCRIIDCSLTGTKTGTIHAEGCQLNGVIGLDGLFNNCGLGGTNTVAVAGNVTFDHCYSTVPGLSRPTLDMNALSTGAKVSVRSYSGGITVTNIDHADDEITLEMSQGKVELASSCTDGTASVRGVATLLDNSAGSTVDADALLAPDEVNIKLNNNFAVAAAGL